MGLHQGATAGSMQGACARHASPADLSGGLRMPQVPVHKVGTERVVVEEDIGVAKFGIEALLHACHAPQHPFAIAIPRQHHYGRANCLFRQPLCCGCILCGVGIDRSPVSVI